MSKYYEYLLTNFGRVHHIGIKYVATILHSNMDLVQNLQKVYAEVAQSYGVTPGALARAVQRYISDVQKDIDVTALATTFDYKLRANQTKLSAVEFLILVKRHLDGEAE